jgi:hypothetical protein
MFQLLITANVVPRSLIFSTLMIGATGSLLQLLVTAKTVHSSLILFTLMMEAIRSSETSALTGAIRHYNRDDGILHSYRHENFDAYLSEDLVRLCSLAKH